MSNRLTTLYGFKLDLEADVIKRHSDTLVAILNRDKVTMEDARELANIIYDVFGKGADHFNSFVMTQRAHPSISDAAMGLLRDLVHNAKTQKIGVSAWARKTALDAQEACHCNLPTKESTPSMPNFNYLPNLMLTVNTFRNTAMLINLILTIEE